MAATGKASARLAADTRLDVYRPVLLVLDQRIAALGGELEAAAPPNLPRGLGKLTSVALSREVCDWKRFNNRRQVASYTGLCPGEHSSGTKRVQGSVTKHGNPRLRAALVELAWLLAHPPTTAIPLRRLAGAVPARLPAGEGAAIPVGQGSQSHRGRAQEGHHRRGATPCRRSLAAAHRPVFRAATGT